MDLVSSMGNNLSPQGIQNPDVFHLGFDEYILLCLLSVSTTKLKTINALQVRFSSSNNAINNASACSVLFLARQPLRVVSSTQKKFRARDEVECSNVSLSAGNNPGVLKNSTEHAETLYIAFRQFPQVSSIQLTTIY